MSVSPYLHYWYHALANPPGLWLKVTDPREAKRLLYNARAACNDPSLDALSIRTAPNDPAGTLWICAKDFGAPPNAA